MKDICDFGRFVRNVFWNGWFVEILSCLGLRSRNVPFWNFDWIRLANLIFKPIYILRGAVQHRHRARSNLDKTTSKIRIFHSSWRNTIFNRNDLIVLGTYVDSIQIEFKLWLKLGIHQFHVSCMSDILILCTIGVVNNMIEMSHIFSTLNVFLLSSHVFLSDSFIFCLTFILRVYFISVRLINQRNSLYPGINILLLL